MTIAREISAEDWSKLSNDDQSLYEKEGESGYRFIGVNPSKLLNAKQHEKERVRKAKEEQTQLQNEVAKLRAQLDEISTPKTEKGEKSEVDLLRAEMEKFKQKFTEQKQDHLKALAQRDEQVKQIELQRVLGEVSAKAFENPHVGSLILEKRLGVTMQDGKPQVQYKDRNGEVDETLDMDGLIKDLAADDRYQGLGIAGTRATGTGGLDKGIDRPRNNYPSQPQSPGGMTMEKFMENRDPDMLHQNSDDVMQMLQLFGESADDM